MTPVVDTPAGPVPIAPSPALPPSGRHQRLLTGSVFFAAFALLFIVQGHIFVPSFDEGLNLEGATRLLDGQRPYVDFFGHASPGAYLYQALVFRIAGRSIWSGRVLVLLYQSAQIALLFWLVSRFASTKAAWCTTFIYTLIETADPVQLSAHHRWDSSTLSFLSIAMALAGIRKNEAGKDRGWVWWSIAGLIGIGAVLATPTAGLMLGATAIWLLCTKRITPAIALTSGAAAGLSALLIWMISNDLLTAGRFGGYFGFFRFMAANYAEANSTYFGFVQGGWFGLFEGAGFADMLVRAPIVLCLSLPALAPLLAVALWSWWTARDGAAPAFPLPKSTAWYLVACQIAMILYPFPRADLQHLHYTAAFAYGLAAIWVAHNLPAKASGLIAMFFMFWSLAFLYQRAATNLNAKQFDTPIGPVMVCGLHQPDVRLLLDNVHPGDTLFVYPFMPTLTFLTQAKNPTAFTFIQPGMMKEPEANALLDDLKRTKPHWIVWFPWTRQDFVRIFPGAKNLPHDYPRIQSWVEANYTKKAWSPGLKFDLLELRTSPGQPALKLP